MAKKRSKKISFGVDKLLYCVAALLAVVAICMVFAPALLVDPGLLAAQFKGTEVLFGLENYFAFSFLNLLTYLFAIAGLVFVLLKLVGAKSKVFDLLGAGLLIAAGVMFFMTGVFAAPIGSYATVYQNSAISLLAGPILAGIFSLLAGAGVLCFALFKRK